ncbi:MAG: hypothetical protein IJU40_07795 [Desulfovibrionaceae bacterium]|nr:hypothetical protein [Desulfovibrionaceae bacterium]
MFCSVTFTKKGFPVSLVSKPLKSPGPGVVDLGFRILTWQRLAKFA